jgi:Flp pilus assembly protein TadG
MQRLKDERGAVAVMVGLLIIPMIAFAAIAIDVAAMWSGRQQLQTAADAGALAIAQDCARGTCGDPAGTAQSLALANVDGEQTNGTVSELTTTQVTVRTSDVKTHSFAPIIGVDQTGISAQATAKWGAPSGGTAVIPLTFSWCDFTALTDGGLPSDIKLQTILFPKTSDAGCTGPSGNHVPGGFGWVNPDPGTCTKASVIDSMMASDTGNSVPSACSPADFQALQNQVVLIPIFDQAGGTGNNAWYQVYGYAAFKITGYHFGGQYSTSPQPCSGNDRCVRGYFTQFVAPDDSFDVGPGAPQLGASVVTLTN